jgi:hypothetical protein
MTMPIPQISPADDELNAELDAMRTIARALLRVGDPQTRLRVLRWTNERFNAAPAAMAAMPVVAAAVNPRPAVVPDPTLTVDALELFPDTAAEMPAANAMVVSASLEPPLDSLVRGFASDFRALALQWQRA